MQLTDFQVDILKHRLESTDAIAECLTENAVYADESFDYDATYEMFYDRVEKWLGYFQTNRSLPESSALTETDKLILVNACGSSLIVVSGMMDDEYFTDSGDKPASKSTLRRHIFQGRELAAAISKLTGMECDFTVE